MTKKMLIIDGNSILNRAFYGIRTLTNKDGLPTNAIYGMITMISRQLEQVKPDYCAVAFDLKKPTFRHRMYQGYKANRKGMPEELAVQLPYAKECMSDMGLTVVSCEGYEADDILGTLAFRFGSDSPEAMDVYLLTGDRDSLQLINDHTSVLLAKNKETVLMNRAAFVAEYGIEPDYFVEVKALMGDASDNIPGVAGIGEKTALKLIAEYKTVQALYDGLDEASLSDGVKKKLRDGKEMAELSGKLAKICTQAPIDTEAESYRYDGANVSELRRLFLKLDFTGLLKRFGLDKVEFVDASVGEPTEAKREEGTSAVSVSSVSELSSDEVLLTLQDDRLTFFDGEKLYTAQTADLSDSALKTWLETHSIICYDFKNIYQSFLKRKIVLPVCRFDCMLAAYVLDSNMGNYSKENLFVRYLNDSDTDTASEWKRLWALYRHLSEEIEKGGFGLLLYQVELPLACVLGKMELCGFKINAEGITAYGQELQSVADALTMRIYSYAGEEFNIGSPKQLSEILFEKMGLPKSKKTKTGYSTDAETLQKLSAVHPIIEDILDYRQVTKLKSTYADGLVKALASDGRVHSVFNQTGTATGRLSSSEPNLQNIPIRTELGRKFRQFFIPENSDYVFIDADYSQIELRLLAHIAGDEAMTEAFLSGEDIHTMTAAKVFGVSPENVTSDLRKKAKAVNFGILYGIGEYSLSEDLGISRAQAKRYIDSYFEQFPQIREYLNRVQIQAKEDGYVTTIFGRRRYIPELASSNKNLQHFGERIAMNSPIQGTAADIIKIAMIRVDEELQKGNFDARLILQVHDELLIECHKDCARQVKELLISCMEGAISCSVPLSVEAYIGNTWFEAKE